MPPALPDASASLARRLLHYARPRQLQLVVRMAELGAIQKAAASLGMAQPSATEALNRVEALLGVTLFDRHARGVRPTREGALLLPALKHAIAGFERLAHDAAQVGQGAAGVVRIAGIAAASTAIAAPALPALCAAHPELWIDYREIEAADIPALCQDDSVDIVLCRAGVEVPAGFVFTPLVHDRLAVYAPVDHPLASRRSVSARSCTAATWLLPPVDSPPHRAFVQLCAQWGTTPPVARVDTRTVALSVALMQRLQLLYVGLESHMGRSVEGGQLRRLPVAVPGAPEAIGVLWRGDERGEGVGAVVRELKRWARE
ncbi:LysR family transcriptional regulator [Xenophilus aerolatus]|nr:LysR family transcriptional regulator [Xenophilus aerolatus]